MLPEIVTTALVLFPLSAHALVFALIAVFGLRSFRGRERIIAAVSSLAAWVSVLAAIGAAVAIAVTGESRVDLGAWFDVGSYLFPLILHPDGTSAALIVLGTLLSAIATRFSFTYLHRAPGLSRFVALLHLATAGFLLVAIAGTIDLVFAGWELLGLSSIFLVGFFQERDAPVRNALRVLVTYRLCDVGLLLAAVLMHYHAHSAELMVALPSLAAEAGAIGGHGWATTAVALGFVLAASGKSAQLPFGTWLPRAMEGPTPSSALFYGGISIHAGAILLLRTWPLLESHLPVRALIVVLGLGTALFGTLVGRTVADAKGSLAWAAMTQLGLIFAEIGLGATTLALVHLCGHACLRTYQLLRAPSALHDFQLLHSAAGGEHLSTGRYLQRAVPRPLQIRLYRLALDRFHVESAIETWLLSPVLRLAHAIDRADRFITRTAPPDPSPPGSAP